MGWYSRVETGATNTFRLENRDRDFKKHPPWFLIDYSYTELYHWRLLGYLGTCMQVYRKCESCARVHQHQGSRWALPRAKLSALCQALFIRERASPQRFCTAGSAMSLWGRSTCAVGGLVGWTVVATAITQILPHCCCHQLRTIYSPQTCKMSFHALSNATSSRSLSSQQLKYKTHGGRNWGRSDENSYPQNRWWANDNKKVKSYLSLETKQNKCEKTNSLLLKMLYEMLFVHRDYVGRA